MKQPKFNWWPWGMMALAVPAFAGGASVIFIVKDPRPDFPIEKFWDAAVVFFSVLGAGNGYLIGIAIGDLGRSMLALIIGAAAGLGAVHALQESFVGLAYIGFLGAITVGTVIGGSEAISGCLTLILLSVIFMFSISSRLSDPEIHLIAGYPLVCSCITACLPLEWTLAAMFGAALSGTRAALHGMLMGVVVFAFFCAFGSDYRIVGAGAIAAAMVANYFCIKALFQAVYRADREAALKPEKPPEPESI